jgi:hypothetical protein
MHITVAVSADVQAGPAGADGGHHHSRGMEIVIVMHLIPWVGGWTRVTNLLSPSQAAATLPTANITRIGHSRQDRRHPDREKVVALFC